MIRPEGLNSQCISNSNWYSFRVLPQYLRDTGYPSEAIAIFNRALVTLANLADDPNNVKTQRDVASIHSNLGDTLMMVGEPAGALVHYRSVQQFARVTSIADPNLLSIARAMPTLRVASPSAVRASALVSTAPHTHH